LAQDESQGIDQVIIEGLPGVDKEDKYPSKDCGKLLFCENAGPPVYGGDKE
jgi:hypothetical protein